MDHHGLQRPAATSQTEEETLKLNPSGAKLRCFVTFDIGNGGDRSVSTAHRLSETHALRRAIRRSKLYLAEISANFPTK